MTLYESEAACGGHTLTDTSSGYPVDLGFQVGAAAAAAAAVVLSLLPSADARHAAAVCSRMRVATVLNRLAAAVPSRAPRTPRSFTPHSTKVYNLTTYPHLVGLFEALGVETQPSDMSFALSMDGGALEWGSHGLDALFAQRANLASPAFLG